MRFRARPAVLAALLTIAAPCGRAAASAETGRDVTGLMDRVLADPADAEARNGLEAAAARAAAAEKAAAEAERAALLAEAERTRRSKEALDEAKALRLSAWQKQFSKACSLAGSADRAGDAVALYEKLLETFPVYSDTRELLDESGARIRGIFFATIKKAYPYLAEGRDTADARMLAALQFSRASERQMDYGGRQPAGVAEAQLKKAQKLRNLETELKTRHETLKEGLSLFSRKRWAEARDKLEEVEYYDRDNEEALHYLQLISEKLKPAPKPVPAVKPTVKPAPESKPAAQRATKAPKKKR